MKPKRLKRAFFARDTLTVARELLGKFLVRKIGKKEIAVMITETEAYCGPKDLASHASGGLTPRTKVMFGPAGHTYIYLIYGMYHCLNIVTERDGYPAAVLIRGTKPVPTGQYLISGKNSKPTTSNQKLVTSLDGPGKLCRFLKIDKSLNRTDLVVSKKLWLEDRGIKIKPNQIKRTPRIGVDYAGVYKDKLWRFVLKDFRSL